MEAESGGSTVNVITVYREERGSFITNIKAPITNGNWLSHINYDYSQVCTLQLHYKLCWLTAMTVKD